MPVNDKYKLIAELDDHLQIDFRSAVYFALLSIGQAVAKSKDIQDLVERIRKS